MADQAPAEGLSREMLEEAMAKVHDEGQIPHVHILHPDGGRCECGLYVTKEMLDGR